MYPEFTKDFYISVIKMKVKLKIDIRLQDTLHKGRDTNGHVKKASKLLVIRYMLVKP